MNNKRASIQMPFRQVWKRPAEADTWGPEWCRVPLADCDPVPVQAASQRPPLRTAPTDGVPSGLSWHSATTDTEILSA
jgi:hypothetical protein